MADASLQSLAYAVAYATFGIGISTVFLRVYCRRFLLKAWGWDDNIALFVGASLPETRFVDHFGSHGHRLSVVASRWFCTCFLTLGVVCKYSPAWRFRTLN